MHLTGPDWGRLLATRRLVDYVVENPSRRPPCARLVLYLGFAKQILEMARNIDRLPRPSNFQGPRLADQIDYRDNQTALVIQNCDLDLQGMLAAQNLGSELDAIAHVYARMVVGSEDDQNCEGILDSLRRGGLRVPPPGTCR